MSRRAVVGFLLGSLTMMVLLVHFFVTDLSIPTYWRDGDISPEPMDPPPMDPPPHEEFPDLNQGPRNSTLGFQKIFYLSLPE